ncbi:MAG: zinc metallopeptidase [Verrucomicrobiota bacterium]
MNPVILIFVATLGLSLLAAWRVKSVYRRYLNVPARRKLNGAEAARRILSSEGIRDVQVEAEPGELTDHYDPLNKRLVLSEENYYGMSVSAISVAAHEAGHAVQHARGFAPLQWRMMAVGATNIASQIVLWLPILGIVTGMLSSIIGLSIIAAGWGVIMLFNLVTLPVEYDASRRAKAILTNSGMVTQEERTGVNTVLNAAALTYVAAFLTSLTYMLYYLWPLLTGKSQS